MNRRRERLPPSAPDFLFKEASPKSYNSAKFPEKPSVARAFCTGGVKKSPPDLYQFLVGMVAPLLEIDTIWRKGRGVKFGGRFHRFLPRGKRS